MTSDAEIGWIAAIIIGGTLPAGLRESFMKSDMGVLMNIVIGIVGAAIASAILSVFGIASAWMDRPPDPRVHRLRLLDLDRPAWSGAAQPRGLPPPQFGGG